MTEWTKNPTETGAYWVQAKGDTAYLAWMHDGNLWFPGQISLEGIDTVKWWAESGAMFCGPLDRPPPCPAFRSNEDRLFDALQDLYETQPYADFAGWSASRRRAEDLLIELKSEKEEIK